MERSCDKSQQGRGAEESARAGGFTMVELAVMVALVALLSLTLVPALARSRANTKAIQCQYNLKQLTAAWIMYSEDNHDRLVASAGGITDRPPWVTTVIDYNPARASNWDITQAFGGSPLWAYISQKGNLFKCPADPSFVVMAGTRKPRVRSISMSDVFGLGGWLNGGFSPSQTVWRTYGSRADIIVPARTFLFMDEHPDSINDGSFAVACTGADQPDTARIIDFPASYHDGGACGISFADGRSDIHRWQGARIKPPMNFSDYLVLNVPAQDAWVDISWLAQNTTVRR